METQKFIRKPFEIEAVQVTAENMEEVAAWCTGLIQNEPKGHYIKVQVHYPLTPRQTKAFVGDWVLKSKKGYKVYTDSAFQTSFVTSEATIVERGSWSSVETTSSIFDKPQELFTTSENAVDPKDAISGKR